MIVNIGSIIIVYQYCEISTILEFRYYYHIMLCMLSDNSSCMELFLLSLISNNHITCPKYFLFLKFSVFQLECALVNYSNLHSSPQYQLLLHNSWTLSIQKFGWDQLCNYNCYNNTYVCLYLGFYI